MKGFDIDGGWYYWECNNCGANGYSEDYKTVLDRCQMHRMCNSDCDETKKGKGKDGRNDKNS